MSSYQDLIENINRYKLHLPERIEKDVLEEVSVQMQNAIRNRIFRDGKDSKGGEIGKYGEKPMTVHKQVFIKPSAFKGKKTMKLEHGYKELREVQGLKSDKVTLKYTGDLQDSFKVRRRQNSIIVGFSSKANTEKAKQLERKYGKVIFKPSDKERTENLKRIRAKLRKIQRQYFYG